MPYHSYTKVAQAAVIPGQVTRYDVEVFPTLDTLQPGHRLRVTIATSDFPHALPNAVQAPNLVGGVYALEHSAAYPSSLELPLVTTPVGSPGGLQPAATSQLGCPAASGWLNGTRLGPVKLGMTRERARAAFVSSSNRGRTFMDFFCLAGSGIRVGYPSTKLLRSVARKERAGLRRRVVLALTSNTHYTLRGVKRGERVKTVAHRLHLGGPFVVGLNTWYLAPGGRSTGVLKTRHGTIDEIGIASRKLTRGEPPQRRFLRSFT